MDWDSAWRAPPLGTLAVLILASPGCEDQGVSSPGMGGDPPRLWSPLRRWAGIQSSSGVLTACWWSAWAQAPPARGR